MQAQYRRPRRILQGVLSQAVMLLVTFVIIEATLRVINFRYLRSDVPGNERSHLFRFDSETGWWPVPNKSATFSKQRTINVSNNSMGLRDIEHESAPKTTVLFVGD